MNSPVVLTNAVIEMFVVLLGSRLLPWDEIVIWLILFSVQATYDQVKAALREASENPTLGKFIGYTEDQVRIHNT